MVDRYRSLGAKMLQEPHGAYVAHADYEALESEYKRLIDIAGEALGFSQYQRDNDTVEVLAHHAKRLGEELAAVKGELAECKDFRKGTIHNAWLTAPREKLIEALQFQGATTKEYMEENAALRARCERLEGERDEYKKRMIYWVNAFLRDFLEWIEEDEVRIEFLKHDMPDTLRKLRKALEVPK